MKLFVIGAFVILAVSAPGQVLKRIDLSKQADINGKAIDTNTLNLSTVPQPLHEISTTPVKTPVVKQKTLKRDPLNYGTVDLKQHATSNVSLKNFAAKRAVIRGTVISPAATPVEKVPITKRQIDANTAEGSEDLRQQLNQRQ